MGRINTANFNRVPLDDWVEFFNDIFEDRNSELIKKGGEESARFMWLKVMEHSTRIAEAIRKRGFFDAVYSVARVFCWICGFVKNNGELLGTKNSQSSLGDILWHKYPRACAYCAPSLTAAIKEIVQSKGALKCCCEPAVEQVKNKKAHAPHLDEYRKTLLRPDSLDKWSDMIVGIYRERCSLMSLDSICFHFLEEVGEVLTMMQMMANFSANFPQNTPVDVIKKQTIYKGL